MRVPDYGHGDWETKYAGNMDLPYIGAIGLDCDTIHMRLSEKADSIKVTGQGHTLLAQATDTSVIVYTMKPEDHYARMTAYFPDGEVIYTNPFARYDASVTNGPYTDGTHSVNILLTILYNMLLLILTCCTATLLIKTIRK